MKQLFNLERGDGPLLVSVPHAGTEVPGEIRDRWNPEAAGLPDTDWFVDRLYDFVPGMGASFLVATHSRYVIDLNRPPDDGALYATRTTGLVPLETFDGHALYQAGHEPSGTEVAARLERYWRPVHAALAAELERIRGAHGHAVLLDAHSIRSRVPRLFEGRLPDLNLGSHGGRSAAGTLTRIAMQVLASQRSWSTILDGRFQGGYITRHYGRPAESVHALQLEMAQSAYMQETPPAADAGSMGAMRAMLRSLLRALHEWRPGH